MLRAEDVETQAAAIKALGALGAPEGLGAVLPFSEDPSWVLRAQAAKAIGILAGPGGIPRLLDLMGDPAFPVRRNAAYALARLGPAGEAALDWVAQDPTADPFARDLATERLQWLGPGGRP
jgi:HEAT repeat protein